jgi:hypothetical protein
VRLRNRTDSTLTISSIATADGNMAFVAGQNCVGPLPAKSDCSVTVTYTPSAATRVTDTLEISDDAKKSPQTVKLRGTGK